MKSSLFKSKQIMIQGLKQGKTEAVHGMEEKQKVHGFRGISGSECLQHEIAMRKKQ